MEDLLLQLNEFLGVCSYPRLNQNDSNWIKEFREKNDGTSAMIEAHFSFVFPTFNLTPEDFIHEIKKQAKGFLKIEFQIKCAIMNNDRTNEYWHALLVPDKGFSDIVKLHDKLYSDILAPIQRLDLDFIPHMGIGNTTDPKVCKKMVDEVNELDIDIHGVIDGLDILQYKDGKFSTIETVILDQNR